MAEAASSKRPPGLLSKLIGAGSAACFAGFYGGFLAKYHVVGELLCSLWLHFAVCAAVLLVGSLLLRKPYGILMNVAVIAVTGWFMAPFYYPAQQAQTAGPRVRIVSCNALSSNPTLEQAVREIRAVDPDVICIFEVNYRVQQAMHDAFLDEYPNYKEAVRADNFGLLVMTRLAWHDAEIFYLWENGVPSLRARVEKDGAQFDLVATHPPPPVSAARFRNRNEHLQRLAEAVGGGVRPLVLCGDLNVTPFSPFLRGLLRELKLRNAAEGFGYSPTWPVDRAAASWIKIPIDYILHDSACVVRDYRVLGATGSDHYPIYAELQLP